MDSQNSGKNASDSDVNKSGYVRPEDDPRGPGEPDEPGTGGTGGWEPVDPPSGPQPPPPPVGPQDTRPVVPADGKTKRAGVVALAGVGALALGGAGGWFGGQQAGSGTVATLTSRWNEFQTKYEGYDKKVTTALTRIDDVERKVGTFEGRITTLTEKLDLEVVERKADVKALKEEIDRLEKELRGSLAVEVTKREALELRVVKLEKSGPRPQDGSIAELEERIKVMIEAVKVLIATEKKTIEKEVIALTEQVNKLHLTVVELNRPGGAGPEFTSRLKVLEAQVTQLARDVRACCPPKVGAQQDPVPSGIRSSAEAGGLEPLPSGRGEGSRVEAEGAFQRGVTAYFAGQCDEAFRDFDQAIRLYPHDPRFYFYRGLVHERFGEGSVAERDWREGARLEKSDASAPRIVGLSLIRVQGPERTRLEAFRD